MNSLDDFLDVLRDDVGLTVSAEDAHRDLDAVPGWDSMHLLTLLTALESRTGNRMSLPAVLEARSLADVYTLAVP